MGPQTRPLSLTLMLAAAGLALSTLPAAAGCDPVPGKAQVEETVEATEEATDAVDLELGREVFLELAQPSCSICHTLAEAEASGTIAPNLDRLQPTMEQVADAVTSGPGIMPEYGDLLSAEEIEAVAHYVATVAGQSSQ